MKKIIMTMMIQLIAFGTLADGLDSLKRCDPMSHDPKCWEPIKPIHVRSACFDLDYCTRIEKIIAFQNGNYICQGYGQFVCTELVKKYGAKVVGLPVQISIQRVDACHIPGGCGKNACQPVQLGISKLSPFCH